jgi:hypothetical protein
MRVILDNKKGKGVKGLSEAIKTIIPYLIPL